jgi:hypothetical protein
VYLFVFKKAVIKYKGNKLIDDNKTKLRYTAPQRRRDGLIKRCNKIILREKQKHNIIEEETKLSSYNCKSVNYNEFKKIHN